MKKLTQQEKLNWFKYKIPGCSNLYRVKINVIHLSVANSKDHEMQKCSKAYDLMKEGFKILTEAHEIATDCRRDLIDISNGEIYEFETTPERAARFIGQPINIIPVGGWTFEDKKWKALKEKNDTKAGSKDN